MHWYHDCAGHRPYDFGATMREVDDHVDAAVRKDAVRTLATRFAHVSPRPESIHEGPQERRGQGLHVGRRQGPQATVPRPEDTGNTLARLLSYQRQRAPRGFSGGAKPLGSLPHHRIAHRDDARTRQRYALAMPRRKYWAIRDEAVGEACVRRRLEIYGADYHPTSPDSVLHYAMPIG